MRPRSPGASRLDLALWLEATSASPLLSELKGYCFSLRPALSAHGRLPSTSEEAVDGNCCDHDQAADDDEVVDRDADDDEAVPDHPDQEHPQHRAEHRSRSPCQLRAADDHRRDRVEFVAGAYVGVCDLRLRDREQRGERGGEAAEHEYANPDPIDAQPGQDGRAAVATHGVDVQARLRAAQDVAADEGEAHQHERVVRDVVEELAVSDPPEGRRL